MKQPITIEKEWLIDLMREEHRQTDRVIELKKVIRHLRGENNFLTCESIKQQAKNKGFGYLFK